MTAVIASRSISERNRHALESRYSTLHLYYRLPFIIDCVTGTSFLFAESRLISDEIKMSLDMD